MDDLIKVNFPDDSVITGPWMPRPALTPEQRAQVDEAMTRAKVREALAQRHDPFAALRHTFNEALTRATVSKGIERHNRPNADFEEQPIMEIPRMLGDAGIGFLLGQIMKKCQEAARLEADAAIKELQDVMVYAATAILHIQEKNGPDNPNEPNNARLSESARPEPETVALQRAGYGTDRRASFEP